MTNRTQKTKGIILGAGIIGSAIAYELSKNGLHELVVLDADLEGSLSSTERNAGGVRHLWQQPINRELSYHSIKFFEQHAQEVGLNQKGYLWLFNSEKSAVGEEILKQTQSQSLTYEKLARSDIRSKYPFLDKLDDVDFALLGSKDGLINSNALKQFYRKEAARQGVAFRDGCLVTHLNEQASGVEVVYHQQEIRNNQKQLEAGTLVCENGNPPVSLQAEFVVVCLGAWTQPLLTQLKLEPLVRPIRRQICFFNAESLDLSPYGMVVDTTGVYFHPEGGSILSGFVLKDEPPGFRFHYDPDFFETYIWPNLYERSSAFEKLKFFQGWSGLYSYTPDTTGILGYHPHFNRVIEAHSFTGRGVMQSYGVAIAVSELILKNKFETIEASVLSRKRFEQSKLLYETLHI